MRSVLSGKKVLGLGSHVPVDADARVVETTDHRAVYVSRRGIVRDTGETLLAFVEAETTVGTMDIVASLLGGVPMASVEEACRVLRGVIAQARGGGAVSFLPGMPRGFGLLDDLERVRTMALQADRLRAFSARGLHQGELYLPVAYVRSLSGIVYDFVMRFPVSHGRRPEDLAEEASLLTIAMTPSTVVPVGPEIHLAALGLAMAPDRLVAHALRPEVVDTVARTRLRSLPDAPPRLVRRSALVEVADPTRDRLFGDTVAIGCYAHEGRHVVLGLEYPRGFRVASWTPSWDGGDVAEGAAVDVASELTVLAGNDSDAHRAWAREAARFLVVLGLLLDVEGAPVEVSDASSRAGRRRSRRRRARATGVLRPRGSRGRCR